MHSMGKLCDCPRQEEMVESCTRNMTLDPKMLETVKQKLRDI
jgi:hypothetical protein